MVDRKDAGEAGVIGIDGAYDHGVKGDSLTGRFTVWESHDIPRQLVKIQLCK